MNTGSYIGLSNFSGYINHNIFERYANVQMPTHVGTLSHCRISNVDNLNISMASGKTITNCVFENLSYSIYLDPNVNLDRKTVRKGYSDIRKTYVITGLTTLTFDNQYDTVIGEAYISSTNATETINLFSDAPVNHPFIIRPETGLILTLTAGTTTNEPILAGGISAVLNGTKGDWIELTYNTDLDLYYQTNGETY
jgi:hypothetical protein